jgi:pimeloyl-ACP methyl ester carboxylesterase
MMRTFVASLFCVLVPWGAKAQTVAPPSGTLTIIRNFVFTPGTTEPYKPLAGLTLGDDGNLYGTSCGVSGGGGQGAIFRVTLGVGLTTIHTFDGGQAGSCPDTQLVKDDDGNFYGTNVSSLSGSMAFRITTGGKFTSLGRLNLTTTNKLLLAKDGNFYGTSGGGNVIFFRMTPDGVVTRLYTFDDNQDGSKPTPLVEGPDGNFYGTMGFAGPGGAGTFFMISPTGERKILATFPAMVKNTDGTTSQFSNPGPITLGRDGQFYGAIASDGQYSALFKVTATGQITRLSRFIDKGIPGFPVSPMILGSDGNFYGTTYSGNSIGLGGSIYGSVFQLTDTGALTWLYQFDGDAAGMNTAGGQPSQLVQGPAGFYGTTPWSIRYGSLSGEVFRLSFGKDGGIALPAAAAPTLSWMDAFDPNQNNLRSLMPAGNRAWNADSYMAFINAQPAIKAVAADGATAVVLRARVSQRVPVTFTVGDPTCLNCETQQVGSVCSFEDYPCQAGRTSITVSPQELLTGGDFLAFAVLMAPVDFARAIVPSDIARAVRQIRVTASLGPNNTAPPLVLGLTLWRPPVVLLHGLWSDRSTWDWPLHPAGGGLQDPRFLVFAADYKDTNAARFLVNLEKPKEAINLALSAYRTNGVAATQVDFVGHSMGGILGRLYAGEYSPLVAYRRDDNLGAGDIHKLITLDTPHGGSELATALVDEAGVLTGLGEVAQPILQDRCVTCGAVLDLRLGSPILMAMPAVKVPSHAIVGVGGGSALLIAEFAGHMVAIGAPEAGLLLAVTAAGLEWKFFGDKRHDLIVSELSQTGGLSGDAVKIFDNEVSLATPDWWAVHTSVTREARIGAHVIEVLNAPVGSSSFGYFGPGGSTPAK